MKKHWMSVFLQKHFFGEQLKHTIELGIANSLYSQNKKDKANAIYKEIIDNIGEENVGELDNIKQQYLGNKR